MFAGRLLTKTNNSPYFQSDDHFACRADRRQHAGVHRDRLSYGRKHRVCSRLQLNQSNSNYLYVKVNGNKFFIWAYLPNPLILIHVIHRSLRESANGK